MIITAIAPYFGCKRNPAMREAIVEALGPHAAFWDVFCGSMAVLLAKPPCRKETVNDLHGDIANLGRVIQHQQLGPKLYRRLRRVWMAEELFRESWALIKDGWASDEPDIDRAFHYFISSWMGMNGVAGTATVNGTFCKRYTNNGGSASTRFQSAVKSIPVWRQRMRQVDILRADAFDLLDKIDDAPGTVIYCDPPYLVKGAKYVHDFKPIDHERLSTLLHRFQRARVVVSYYEHPDLAKLYPDWTKRNIDVAKSMGNGGKRDKEGGGKAPEVLLINQRDEAMLF